MIDPRREEVGSLLLTLGEGVEQGNRSFSVPAFNENCRKSGRSSETNGDRVVIPGLDSMDSWILKSRGEDKIPPS